MIRSAAGHCCDLAREDSAQGIVAYGALMATIAILIAVLLAVQCSMKQHSSRALSNDFPSGTASPPK